MLEFAEKYPEAVRCLPIIDKEVQHLPWAYIANVINTIVGDRVEKWVKKIVDQRHAKLVNDKKMEIEMDEEIAEIYR